MSARSVVGIRRQLCQYFGRSQKLSCGISPQRPLHLEPYIKPACSYFVRHQSTAQVKVDESPLPIPPAAGTPKEYAPKLKTLVDNIASLTLMEVADLNELLKKTLNIPDQPMMGAGFAAAPVAAASEEEGVKKKEKTSFTIRLMKFDDTRKVQLIKEIKTVVEGLNLVQAKKYVESLPQTVRQDIPKDEAEKLKAQLEAVGGTVEMD